MPVPDHIPALFKCRLYLIVDQLNPGSIHQQKFSFVTDFFTALLQQDCTQFFCNRGTAGLPGILKISDTVLPEYILDNSNA